jgi:hypothetical protein
LTTRPPFALDRLLLRTAESRIAYALDGPATQVDELIETLVDEDDHDARETVFTVLFVLLQTGHLQIVTPLPDGF